MNLRQLEYFVAIAEEHQVTAAARRLHITQPPLSYELGQLERELGCRLVNRGPRSVELTEPGKVLYERALQILALTGATEHEVRSLGEGEGGTLSLGVISSSGGRFPTPSMAAYVRDHPEVRLELHEGNTYQLLDMLRRGVVDATIVRTPFPEEGLECHYGASEPLVAVIPRGVGLAAGDGPLALADLVGQPLVLYRRFEGLVRSCMDDAGLPMAVACLCDDARTTCVWASRGVGVGLVPRSFASIVELGDAEVRELDCERLVTRMGMAVRRDRYVPPLARRFVDLFERDVAATIRG